MSGPRTGGKLLADQLALHGCELAFCVPGESYLPLLDGLYDHRDRLRVVTCRHEAAAANAAEASRQADRPARGLHGHARPGRDACGGRACTPRARTPRR